MQTDDSLIWTAVRYYDLMRDNKMQAQAYYYWGNRDLGNAWRKQKIGISAMEFVDMVKDKALNFTGGLFLSEHNRWFSTENTPIQIMRDTDRRLTIAVNRIPFDQ